MKRQGVVALVLALLPAPAAWAGDAQSANGRIESVQPAAQQLTVRTDQGQTLVLHVGAQARLEQQGKPATLDHFRKGMAVQVTYTTQNGQNQVATLAPAVSTRQVEDRVRDTLAAVKNYTFEHKGEYQQRLHQVLRDTDTRIHQLQRQAAQAGAEARTQLEGELTQLRRLRDRAQVQLRRVESATPAVWNDLKTGVGAAFEDLRQAFEKAGRQLR